jgi:hypothetical protein
MTRAVTTPAMTIFRQSIAAVACAASVVGACGSPVRPSPPAPPDPATLVVPIEATGPVQIRFLGATPAPGSTISGCGTRIDGCRGRLRLTFRLVPTLDGPVLRARLYLHSMRNLQACLWGDAAPISLVANRAVDLELTLDQADVCAVPDTMATMDLSVEGPAPVASRQAWTVRYQFAP